MRNPEGQPIQGYLSLREQLQRSSLHEILLKANHSKKRADSLHYFAEAKREGRLHLLNGCSDARAAFLLTGNISKISSIAGAINPNFYSFAFNHPSFESVTVATHFDGTAPFADGIPVGCGGLSAKKTLGNIDANTIGKKGLLHYVVEEVMSQDPVNQAMLQALNAVDVMKEKKPIFIATLDHITGKYHYFAALIREGDKIRRFSAIDFENYKPEKVYENKTVPEIAEDQLPDDLALQLQTLRLNNSNTVEAILKRNPRFHENQRIQNPSVLTITTSIKPAGIAYPEVAGPNDWFSIRVPYGKEGGIISVVEAQKAFDQAEYVITHANEAIQSSDSGKSFYNTRHVLIESDDFLRSAGMAHEFQKLPFVHVWRNLGGEIYIGAFESGKGKGILPGRVTRMEKFTG